MGCLAAAVLTVNNIRDLDTDQRAGKRTLPVRLGRRGACLYYGLLLALPYAVVLGLVLRDELPALAAVPLLTLPLAIRLFGIVRGSEDGPVLNRALGATAGLLLVFGVLLSAGTAWG